MDEIVFEVADFNQTLVVLTRTVWEKKILSPTPIGHPEVAPYLDMVSRTIAEPDVVFQSTRRPDSSLFYCLNINHDENNSLHLVVVIKYLHEPSGKRGYVSTIYLTRKLYAKGEILWVKKQKLNH
jgi:hypothetical protein